MREIKFRAWYYYSGMNYNPIVSDGTDGGETSRVCLNSSIDDFDGVLMQYTGLTDKTGKEIYEGDYVEVKSLCLFGEDKNCRGVVDFIECGFVVTDRKTFANPLFVENCDIEIIGNIYENKELLND